MDAESQYFSLDSLPTVDRSSQNISSFHLFNSSGVRCLLCRRTFSLEAEVNDGFEAIHICRECKIMVLDDNPTTLNIRDIRRLRRRRRDRFRSLESMEDSFSRRFSQLINLANHNDETQPRGDTPVTALQRLNAARSDTPVTALQRLNAARSRSRSSRRWQTAFSDNDSDVFDQSDSLFVETDSNVSFSAYGGESDASLDRYSILDRELFLQLENESYASTDTDIDPMHAGHNQWNSDDQDDEDGESEEAEWGEANRFEVPHPQFQDTNITPSGYETRATQDDTWFQLRVGETRVRDINFFPDFGVSEFRPDFVVNPGDYVDARGFEALLEQLAETDNTRRGAPPAAASSVRILPSIIVSKDPEKNGAQICAVCKDLFLINTEAKQLPCMHLYHPSCILPWLNIRNSCPVCRYELPTDDPDYEEAKRNLSRTLRNEPHPPNRGVETSNTFTELEADEASDSNDANAQLGRSEDAHHVANRSRDGSGVRWLVLAAAPIVSIVGIALVFWFRKPASDGRMHGNIREQRLHRSQATTSPDGRSKKWWSIF